MQDHMSTGVFAMYNEQKKEGSNLINKQFHTRWS